MGPWKAAYIAASRTRGSRGGDRRNSLGSANSAKFRLLRRNGHGAAVAESRRAADRALVAAVAFLVLVAFGRCFAAAVSFPAFGVAFFIFGRARRCFSVGGFVFVRPAFLFPRV